MTNLFILMISLAPLFSHAELRSQKALTYTIENGKFEAQLNIGFHFNDQAPNSIIINNEKRLPQKFQANHLSFPYKGEPDSFALLYVCDDKLTFCETHKIALSANKGASENIAQEKLIEKKVHGFNQVPFATALQKNKGMILLNFTAKWCPGCVRFKTEVFDRKEFINESKNMYKLMVDVDHFENFELSESYKIKGIPTLIVTDKMGHEIHRLVGFEPLKKVTAFLKAVNSDPTTLKDYAEKSQVGDDKVRLRAGIRFHDAEDFANAIRFLQEVQVSPPQFLNAKVQLSKEKFESDKSNREQYVSNLRQAIAAEPRSSRSLSWRTDLIKMLEPKSKEIEQIRNEGVQIVDELLRDNKKLAEAIRTDQVGEFVGYEKWVVLMYKVDLFEAAGASDEDLEKIYSEAADIGIQSKIPIKLQGPNLRLLVMLTSAKKWPEAETHVLKMLKADPKSTDLKRRYAKILLSLSKFNEAKQVSESIIDKVEGRNEFWVAEILAKSFIGLKDMSSAKKILTLYLGKPEIQEEKMKSVKSSFEKLLASTATEGKT